ncbi:MAG: hypothetical protein K0S93_1734 [Nitrososphaeraceae archaeon]|nr:hypothetical protein [Nitrososphaeraceae archaeon]
MYTMYILHTDKYNLCNYYLYMNDIPLTSTMRISDETKRELVKIGAQLSIKDGSERSMEDVVKYLIETYKKTNKRL